MRWTAVLAVLLFAGCLDPGPAAPAAVEEAGRMGRSGVEDGTVRTFDASFDLVLNPDHELLLATLVAGNRNCVLFSDGENASYQVFGGTATLTWDAVTPLAEELVLTAFGFAAPVNGAGRSPLTLDLTGLELPPDSGGIAFMADHELPDLPVQQAARLQVTFDYQGELPTPMQGFCTNGLT